MTSDPPRANAHHKSTGSGLTDGGDPRGDHRVQIRIALIGAAGAIIAATVGAYIGLKPGPSPSPPSGPSPAPRPTSECVFLIPNSVVCASSNPVIVLESNNLSDTIGCTFTTQVDWGDGSPEQAFNLAGGPAGPAVINSHKYNKNGTYVINAHSLNVNGPCTAVGSSNYSFTLGS